MIWYQSLITMVVGGIMVAIGVGIGGWLVFRGKTNQDTFLAGPKGEVFTIPEAAEEVAERTKDFLKVLENES